jgi:heptosyltransferase-1
MKILIIRLSAIGDVFFCTSLLKGLKELHPASEVTWLTEPMGARILCGHPLLDRLLTLPRRQWVADFKGLHWIRLAGSMRTFLKDLRRDHFDLVIDPQGLLKSAIWAKAARADRRIGVNGRDGSRHLYDTVIRMEAQPQPPILSEYRKLLELLGGDPARASMQLHVVDTHQQQADAFLKDHNAAQPVVFCPFTTRPQKHWFNKEWARLGEILTEAGLGPVVILGGPGDGEAAREIARQMSTEPVIAAGEERPIGFALGILKRARGIVGVDTGLTHAGIAFNRPTLCLFGSTRPYVKTGSPWARVLYHDLDCAPCKRHPTCDGRFDCMRLHTAETVARNIMELMDVD